MMLCWTQPSASVAVWVTVAGKVHHGLPSAPKSRQKGQVQEFIVSRGTGFCQCAFIPVLAPSRWQCLQHRILWPTQATSVLRTRTLWQGWMASFSPGLQDDLWNSSILDLWRECIDLASASCLTQSNLDCFYTGEWKQLRAGSLCLLFC